MSSRHTPAASNFRKVAREQARLSALTHRPIGALVQSVDARLEQVSYLDAVSSSNYAQVLHPYMGPLSWIRVMPEPGSGVMTQKRGDYPTPMLTNYTNLGAPGTRVDKTELGQDIYRALDAGEFDVLSSGLSYLHGSSRGTLNLRGGAVHTTLSHDQLEIQSRAPTHRVEAFGYKRGSLQNTQRFGVVKRPTQPAGSGSTAAGTPTLYERPVRVDDTGAPNWGLEHTTTLYTKGLPSLLMDVRQGNVVADDGTRPTDPRTGNKLRIQGQWGTTQDGEVVKLFLDEKGNCSVQLPPVAEQGFSLDVTGGPLTMQSKSLFKILTQDVFRVQASGNVDVESNTDVKVTAATTMTLKAPTIVLDAPITRAGGTTATLPVAMAETSMALSQAVVALISTATVVVGGVPYPIVVNPAALAAYDSLNSAGVAATTLFAR